MKKIRIVFSTALAASMVMCMAVSCSHKADAQQADTAAAPEEVVEVVAVDTAAMAADTIPYRTTASGLKYKVLKEGTGKSPAATDVVMVNYEGKLLDGTVFDSSYRRGEPATFPLNRVIAGWTEGLQLMKEGATYEFLIPYQLAYGDMGSGPIPPKADLIFKVELIQVMQ